MWVSPGRWVFELLDARGLPRGGRGARYLFNDCCGELIICVRGFRDVRFSCMFRLAHLAQRQEEAFC